MTVNIGSSSKLSLLEDLSVGLCEPPMERTYVLFLRPYFGRLARQREDKTRLRCRAGISPGPLAGLYAPVLLGGTILCKAM